MRARFPSIRACEVEGSTTLAPPMLPIPPWTTQVVTFATDDETLPVKFTFTPDQTGRFVYTVQPDSKVARVPVQVLATTAAAAVVEGVQPGARVVTEGAQNLRPGSVVREATARGASAPAATAAGH